MNDKSKEEIKKVLHESEIVETKFYTLVDMKVTMLDWPNNPYKTMVNMALQTWGNEGNKWSLISPETRFEVMKAILQKKALPLALEHPVFSFQIDRIDRSTFDQLARARIGVVFSSKGSKDDSLEQLGFVIPSRILGTEYEEKFKSLMIQSKELYREMVLSDIPNWAARSVIGIYAEHNFIMSANFMAIQNLLSKRLETSEQEGCVAFSILVREAIKKRFPLLSEYLRPSCDLAKKDMTGPYNGFSDIIGVPHQSDDRQPGYDQTKTPQKWSEPCTDIKLVERMIGVHLPDPLEWKDYEWSNLGIIDMMKFMED